MTNKKYHDEYSKKIYNLLLDEDIRVEYDNSEDRFNKKIMNSINMKNPYTVVIGDNERDNNLISYKKLGSEDTVSISVEDFIKLLKEDIKKR